MSVLSEFSQEVRKLFQKKKFTLEDRKILRELGATDEITTSQAIAVLLAEVAMIDQNFDEQEYGFIFTHLEKHFELTQKEVKGLIEYGSSLISNLQSTELFSKHLKENLSLEDRNKLMNVLESLIQADGVEHGFEIYLKERLQTTLEVS